MSLTSARELEHSAEAWRPWRAYAAMYLWRSAPQRAERGNGLAASTMKTRDRESTTSGGQGSAVHA
jgi:hypothetical protein